jgi:hypothetical protein
MDGAPLAGLRGRDVAPNNVNLRWGDQDAEPDAWAFLGAYLVVTVGMFFGGS